MEQNELLKGIEEDEILKSITEEMQEAIDRSKNISAKAEKRETELMRKLEFKRNRGIDPINTWDLEAIEKQVESSEDTEIIERKILALQEVKRRPYDTEPSYREATSKYFTYCTPIFTDLENAKVETLGKIEAIKNNYRKDIAELQGELVLYEDEINKLFSNGEQRPIYQSGKIYDSMFCRTTRADVVSSQLADRYKHPLIIEVKEPGPKITKHQSLNGVQDWFAAKPKNCK